MGFFDYRCLVTNLSLRAERAVALLIEEVAPGRWAPASLPVRGQYNRLGTVDGVERDAFAEPLAEAFEHALQTKRLKLVRGALNLWKDPGEDFHGPRRGIDRLLYVVERVTTFPPCELVLFDGRPIYHVLIQEDVYDAAVAALAPDNPGADSAALQMSAFQSEAGRWFYRRAWSKSLAVREGSLRALAGLEAFSKWFEARAAWRPGSVNQGQHDSTDTIVGYHDALRRFESIPWMREALERAATEAERKESEGWPSEWSLPQGCIFQTRASWYGLVFPGERVAWVEPEGLSAGLEEVLAVDRLSDRPARLLDGEVWLVVVQRGECQPPVDARTFVRLLDGNRAIPIADRGACEELLTRPNFDATVDVDQEALQRVLPPLSEPRAARGQGKEALLLLPERKKPVWLAEDEWPETTVFEFAHIYG